MIDHIAAFAAGAACARMAPGEGSDRRKEKAALLWLLVALGAAGLVAAGHECEVGALLVNGFLVFSFLQTPASPEPHP